MGMAADIGAEVERAKIVAWLRERDWNTWLDHTGELEEFNGDHTDLVREVAAMIERGEHMKGCEC